MKVGNFVLYTKQNLIQLNNRVTLLIHKNVFILWGEILAVLSMEAKWII